MTNPNIKIHHIGHKQVEIFNKAQQRALKEVDSYKFGLIGRIGSLNEMKNEFYDIDNIISPAKEIGLGEVIIEQSRLYGIIDKYVRESGYYLALVPKMTYQEEVYELSAQANGGFEKQIPIHTLLFIDKKSVISVTCDDFVSRIEKKIQPILGNVENLIDREIINPKKLEQHFYIAESQIGIYNNLPEDFALRKGYLKLNYLLKHYDIGLEKRQIDEIKNINQMNNLVNQALLYSDKNL